MRFSCATVVLALTQFLFTAGAAAVTPSLAVPENYNVNDIVTQFAKTHGLEPPPKREYLGNDPSEVTSWILEQLRERTMSSMNANFDGGDGDSGAASTGELVLALAAMHNVHQDQGALILNQELISIVNDLVNELNGRSTRSETFRMWQFDNGISSRHYVSAVAALMSAATARSRAGEFFVHHVLPSHWGLSPSIHQRYLCVAVRELATQLNAEPVVRCGAHLEENQSLAAMSRIENKLEHEQFWAVGGVSVGVGVGVGDDREQAISRVRALLALEQVAAAGREYEDVRTEFKGTDEWRARVIHKWRALLSATENAEREVMNSGGGSGAAYERMQRSQQEQRVWAALRDPETVERRLQDAEKARLAGVLRDLRESNSRKEQIIRGSSSSSIRG